MQNPLVKLGTTFNASGHQVTVTKIEKSGITVSLPDRRTIKLDLKDVERMIGEPNPPLPNALDFLQGSHFDGVDIPTICAIIGTGEGHDNAKTIDP